ncbi:MAG: carboxypeptidase regulatory-like domain-containing protein [Bacteroidales bacterium]|nr:carboxypeptidase regulatory-like domain-containing protein [Bacteroidales bacterium]
MLRNLLFTLGIILTANLLVFSQSGSLKGKIIDKETKEPIPFANIIVESGGAMMGGSTSDFEGNYVIKPLTPGKYNVKATYVGYKPLMIQGVLIHADQIRFLDIELETTAIALKEFEVIEYEVPLISKDQTASGATVTAEDIAKMPNRSANAVATTVGGVYSADGERGSVRGSRADATVMYIDGIKVMGSSTLPAAAIEQVSVILGGVPAQYGDATGGIINVTTKGASRNFGAGVELETSQLLDKFGYNRVALNLQGPLIKGKKDEATSLLGYFIAGDATYMKDGRPTATGVYKVKDDVLEQLEKEPLRPSGLPTGGTYQNAEFIRNSDLEHMDATQNTSRYGFNVSGKIDVRTTSTINLTFGGTYNYNNRYNYSYFNSLYNYDKNALITNNTWRVFGRFTQRFPTGKDSKAFVKNVYYNIQVDYSKYHWSAMDEGHKDDFFKYGYLGKFHTDKISTYELGDETVNGKTYTNVWLLNSWDYDTTFSFQKKDYNPIVANYTQLYYNSYPEKYKIIEGLYNGYWENLDQVQQGGGLLNGQTPPNVYNLWASPGTNQVGYQVVDNSQLGINVSGAADLGNHELKFGFQYEQLVQRGYNYAPTELWTLMRGLTNFHIIELDEDNPFIVERDGVFQDTIKYYRKYDAAIQRTFDINLRKKLGLPVDGLDYILIDSYDMDSYSIDYYDKDGNFHTVNLGEDLFSMDMFSPDELLYNGTYYAFAYGYDYNGNKLTSKPSFDDFFTKKDDNGDFLREIPAFEPIYMAGYIQDKFSFRDLVFNIGIRVDRFDANQKVLKDPFLMYPARTVHEVSSLAGEPVHHPSNMGGEYIVYVNKVVGPTEIVGYRFEDTWYNAEGTEIQDPTVLDKGFGISPYLVDPSQKVVTSDAFEDYEPQISVMPRIAFSFPISDEALFFAHYDVLTQRPTSNLFSNPSTYLFIYEMQGAINNPNLKPSKTIDYELGFQQKLTNTSSLIITTFYREIRDDIQIYRYYAAYPRDYTTFNNIDFGTVKGLTLSYDLRRTNNARIRASYTLQFADGTGSSTTTAEALVASGLPNLRTMNPLAWDRRHAINLVLDYRFAKGKDYNGPTINRKIKGTDKVKPIQLLNNTGFSLTLNGGSGIPYTRQENITSLTSGGTRELKGTYFGSRIPWQFRMDVRFDKDIDLSLGKNKKSSYLNVYFQILNILNTKNILGVYPATGNPDDDGYLAAAEWQRQIDEQLDSQAYRDLYAIRINNPANYSLPRRIRVGVIFNF